MSNSGVLALNPVVPHATSDADFSSQVDSDLFLDLLFTFVVLEPPSKLIFDKKVRAASRRLDLTILF